VSVPSINVLQEIVTWSKDRPTWQRDALRRLVVNGELTEQDIRELADICEGDYGLGQKKEFSPLTKEQVPAGTSTTSAVSLESIFHHKGVNALAESQTLKFGPALTIVYGDNGAGKTGYTRILKRACHARGREEILGNVVSGTAPPKLEIAIKYKVGTDPTVHEWTGGETDEFVSRVSVFDTHCATVYLNDKTNVAFLPFGLDLFDKLVKACKAVRTLLEADQRALNSSALASIISTVPEGTAAVRLVTGITGLTKSETVLAVTRLSAEEEKKRAFLEQSIRDLQANDPEKLLKQLMLRAGRIRALFEHLKKLEDSLGEKAVDDVFNVRAEGRRKSEEAKRLREATFPAGLLPGTGGDQWKTMWDSAKQFSEQQAYPGKSFPVVDHGAKCLLCQQNLEHAAAHRLKQFQEFVMSTTERELRQLREDFARKRSAFSVLVATTDAVTETLAEIRLENETVADLIDSAIAQIEKRRAAVVAALGNNTDLGPDFPALAVSANDADGVARDVDARIRSLRDPGAATKSKAMESELRELNARVLVRKHEQTLLDEIERKKKIAAFGQCIDETKPTAITQKGSAVTKGVVSERLKTRFREELVGLDFTHVEVELKEAGGAEGVFYHKLALTRAPGAVLPKVVSEGEQRCLSIAAFFAELSTADDPSGIVFDDPVSSLDVRWRRAVAARLVQESKTRQVIVFTHDVVFLLELHRSAKDMGVVPFDQHVRYTSKGAGVCLDELPWAAMAVKKRIGHIRSEWQTVDKLYRDGHQDQYEKEAKNLYGILREAWERGIEEVLLGGVVERFRSGVQTQQIASISDITPEDTKAVEKGMSKCSTWLRGHDQSPAVPAPVPKPTELKADIDELDNWVKAINKRRGR
jgi:energy-coupling factor transporter ATP-binding protein EcfA2